MPSADTAIEATQPLKVGAIRSSRANRVTNPC
jgi:hypothetical protein